MLNPALIEMYAREQQRDLAMVAAAEAQLEAGAGARPRRGLGGLLAALRRRRPEKPLPQTTMRPAAGASALR